MGTQTEIRMVETKDVPHILEIVEATELFQTEFLDDMIAGYLDGETDDVWFLASINGRAVGFGFCEAERMTVGTWSLLAIAVHPSFQRTGVGADMMAYIEARLADQGERVLIVETMGTPDFQSVQDFCKKCGYDEEARIREFYEEGADKVVFWKHL